ncbi:MAG: FAD-dependent oxidoreductase [Planctomycetota bacterium]
MRFCSHAAAALMLFSWWAPAASAGDATKLDGYDVVIAGGSTAALAAAFAAADEGCRVALLEPTDWIGGQLTSSGVPAVDEAWHKFTNEETGELLLNVSAIARDPRNMTPWFRDALAQIGNPGRGWVSRYCFKPRLLLDGHLLPREHALSDRLTVFRRTVVKQVAVEVGTGRVTSLTAIRRAPLTDAAARETEPPSKVLADWYSPTPSERFTKEVLVFARGEGKAPPVFIDATEWGELLVLADAPYLQGAELAEDSDLANEPCGQAITYGFVQRYNESPVAGGEAFPSAPNLGFGSYRERDDAWSRVWTYRRIYATGAEPTPGDLSLQNWGYDPRTGESGNDYPGRHFLLPREEAAAQRGDWQGGVDIEVLAAAERQAYAWHDWFRNAAPEGVDPKCFTLDREVLGAAHGLSKLPYIRDTRRAIGLDGFRLKITDLTGPAQQQTGTRFEDRVALGAYAADIHPLAGCSYDDSLIVDHKTLPFYLPYRALTVDKRPNLLVAGKTMAQTFLANSATRLHPIEWSTGCAAGAAAAFLAKTGGVTRDGLEQIEKVQAIVRRHTPIDWTIEPEHAPVASR